VRRYVLALVPAGLGVILAALWQAGLLSNFILYLRADVGTLFLLLGLMGSVAWGLGLVLWGLACRRGDQVLAQLHLEQADSRRRFIRRLDHELKNPLTAIRAGLANLADRNDGPILSSVRAQVDRLARLTADLRKLADLETRTIEHERVDLGGLLQDVLEVAQERRKPAACPISLHLPQVPWPLSPVVGDRDLLLLALHNVVDNACKFSRPEDKIEVRAFEDGAFVAIEVADTGPGIREDELSHLGEELYRGSAAHSIEGSGLGLALVKMIVKRHGGTMSIRSREGQGTLVTLRLPAQR
jgi:two-component system OmpR family sensor kinase